MSEKNRYSILIVDDERSNIRVLNSILNPDYTVYAASDGPDALEAAEEFLPDLILLDIMMPDMDGYEVFSKLKDSENTRNTPVIFITGLDSKDDKVKGLSMGASDYIAKPFNTPTVKIKVKNQISIIERNLKLGKP